MNEDQSLFAKKYPPLYQAAFVLAIAVVIMVFAKLLSLTGAVEVSFRFYWMTSCSFLLFFAMFNSILSLSSGDLNKYWLRALLAFAALAIGSGLFATLISGVGIVEAGRIRYVYIVLIFGYLVFLCIMGMVKTLMAFFMKEEENLRASGTRDYKKKAK